MADYKEIIRLGSFMVYGLCIACQTQKADDNGYLA